MKNLKGIKIFTPGIRTTLKVSLYLLILTGCMLTIRPGASETNDTLVQTDWSAGESADTAVHPANKTGWAKYQTKDDNIYTAAAGRINLSTTLQSVTDTSDTDFGEGTLSGVEISGTGDSASLALTGGLSNPFVSNAGKWLSPPEAPGINWWSPYVKAGSYIYCLWDRKTFGRWDIANEKCASQIIINDSDGLIIGLINQYRYWTKSRARLCGLQILRDYMDAFPLPEKHK